MLLAARVSGTTRKVGAGRETFVASKEPEVAGSCRKAGGVQPQTRGWSFLFLLISSSLRRALLTVLEHVFFSRGEKVILPY